MLFTQSLSFFVKTMKTILKTNNKKEYIMIINSEIFLNKYIEVSLFLKMKKDKMNPNIIYGKYKKL